MVASLCLCGRAVMKITATPLALAALNNLRAGSMALALALEDQLVEAARACRQHIASPIRHETEIVGGEQIRPVAQRGLVDIEHERGLLYLVGVLLDISLRRFEHSCEVHIVVFLVIVAQQILDRAEIERPLLRIFGNVVFNRGRTRLRSGRHGICRN